MVLIHSSIDSRDVYCTFTPKRNTRDDIKVLVIKDFTNLRASLSLAIFL